MLFIDVSNNIITYYLILWGVTSLLQYYCIHAVKFDGKKQCIIFKIFVQYKYIFS